jgi:hypothetical protein
MNIKCFYFILKVKREEEQIGIKFLYYIHTLEII